MPFVPVDGTAEFDFNQRLYNQQVQNSIYLYAPGLVWTTEDLEDACQTLYDWFVADIMAPLSNQLSLIEVRGKYLATEAGAIATYAPTTPGTGAASAQPLPNNVALTISFRTGLSGRSFRGRNYIAGIPENTVDGNVASNALIASLLTGYNILPTLASGLANPAEHVVVSRISGGQERPSGVTTPVQSYLVTDATVDSQRRRLPGRGR